MFNNIKFVVSVVFLFNLYCTDINNSSEPVNSLPNGCYILKQPLGTMTTQQELSIDNNTFHYYYKQSDGTIDLDFLAFTGTYTYIRSLLYMQIETGYEKIAMSDSNFINIPSVPEKKAVLIEFSFDTLKMYGGAIVFRRDSSYSSNIWGKWKSTYTMGTGITAIPVGKVFKNKDSLTYLTLNNDSTWLFQSFDARSQAIVSTGKIKQIIEIKELLPSVLMDSMFVFDSKNDLILAFWDFKRIPDIMIRTN